CTSTAHHETSTQTSTKPGCIDGFTVQTQALPPSVTARRSSSLVPGPGPGSGLHAGAGRTGQGRLQCALPTLPRQQPLQWPVRHAATRLLLPQEVGRQVAG